MNTKRPATNLFKFLSCLMLAAASITLFARPAFAYEEDTHFLMTYVLCRSAGFTDEEALIIAAVDQGMDDSTATNAHDEGKPQIEEEWRWHSLDKDGKMHAAGIIARRDLLFKEALEETDPRTRLIRLGIFFHYQQDTWAHRHHEKSNHLSRDAFTTYNTPTGHGPWGSKPDRPPLDPVAALMCLEDGIVYATEFLRRALKREPNPFLNDYKPKGGKIDKAWKDGRKGKYFNQLDVSSEKPGSAILFLKSLIVAQINAYTRSRDFNPFYAPQKTPDLAKIDLVRANLQVVCDSFKSSVGKFTLPTERQKLTQGFTEMTTEGLLSLSDDERIPVVLIPGLGATDLRPGKKGIWNDGYPNDLLRGKAGDPEKLQFDSNGQPRRDTVSKDMVAVKFWNVPVITDITDLSEYLQKKEKFRLDRDLFEFPYDFRFSVTYNASKLAELIKHIQAESKTRKVDVISHSMGGMIAKVYLADAVNAANVRKAIFVGTPYLGAPKVLKALRYGDDLGIPVIDGCKNKRVARNLPGLYNLLPGRKYIEARGGYYFDDDDIDGNSVRGLLDYEQMLLNLKNGKESKCLLKPEIDYAPYDKDIAIDHLNRSLIDKHLVEFNEKIDKWVKPAGVEVINIVGYGLSTMTTIREKAGKVTYGYSNEGDGTVPLWSAEGILSDQIYYFDLEKIGCDHASMIGHKTLLEQIRNLLAGRSVDFTSTIRTRRPSRF